MAPSNRRPHGGIVVGLGVVGMLLGSSVASAADVPIVGLKLIVVDKMAAASKAKAVFVAKDGGVTKGAGTDPAQIEATLDIAYDAVSGTFVMPQGTNWLANSDSVGKYVNKTAPTVGGAVKVSVIKPTLLVKVVGKSLGDVPLDISSAPTGNVYVVDTIVNDGETTRLCTQFAGCVHKLIAGDTGYKLICKGNSSGDAACTAAVTTGTTLATTTTSSSTTSTTVCVATSGTFCDLGTGVIADSATGLEWEKKTTTVGSGVNGADLHDVDNRYRWAGTCSVTTSKYCQPNLAAETACKAQTPGAYWTNGCEQCVGGDGTCTVAAPAITTAWDWLAQVNAANYAGNNDWRLPSESGCNACYTNGAGGLYQCTACSAHELETILLSAYLCGPDPCINSIFGSTGSDFYWSASTYATTPGSAWFVTFDSGAVAALNKTFYGYVRAVRGGS